MANITPYLTAILNAVYGEEVRESIYNAIDLINKVGEKALSIGTAVSSSSSSTTDYYVNSLYINSDTSDLWKCTGTSWSKVGTLRGTKGDKGDTGNTGDTGPRGKSIGNLSLVSTSDTGKTYGVYLEDGTLIGTFEALKGPKGDIGNTGSIGPQGDRGLSIKQIQPYSQTGRERTYQVLLEDNTIAGSFIVMDGEKGDTGNTGYSPRISVTKSGKVATVYLTDVTGTQSFEVRDGNDGSGTGDMLKATYDADDDGVVDLAKKVSEIDNTPTAGSDNPVKSGGVYSQIGDLSSLRTTAKGDVVSALNEVKDSVPAAVEFDTEPTSGSQKAVRSGGLYNQIGNLTELETTDKTNLVAAINEAAQSGGTDDYVQKSGDSMTGPLTIYDSNEQNYGFVMGTRATGSTVGLGSMVTGRVGTASGIHAIAEGNTCNATGNYSSARGSGTTASGNFSVADGNGGQASGLGAHVSGLYNRATADYQFVAGKYNDHNDEFHNDAIFEVGVGTAISNRKNGLQVMKNGDLRILGDIYLNDGTSLESYIRSIVNS